MEKDNKEGIQKLRPVERLYLLSKEIKDVYNKKNTLYCLCYYFLKNKNIIPKGDKYQVKLEGKELNIEYEAEILNLIKSRHFIELDKFITDLTSFDNTLINHGIYENSIKEKKFLFFNLAKKELIKTKKYYILQGYLKGKMVAFANNPLLAICFDEDARNKTLNLHTFIKTKIQSQYFEESKKKEKQDKNKKSNDKVEDITAVIFE